MKKILLLITTVIMAAVFVGCVPSGSLSVVSAVKPEYESKDLSALASSLVEQKLIDENAIKTDAEYIGAEEGYRYASADLGDVEIYYFSKTDGEYYVDGADGEISLFGADFKTALSKDKKFMLIYSKDVDLEKLKEKEINLLSVFEAYPDKLDSSSDSASSD